MWKLLLLCIGAETVTAALRCNGIDNGCCTVETPCLEGDGDCDSDDHCAEGLVCGENNCPWGDGDECCIKALRCNGIDDGCCTVETPCLEGDGDCDNDDHCAEGLVCGENNCPWGDGDECCIKGFLLTWAAWSEWGVCSKTCEGGEQKRSRKCLGGKAGVSTKCDGDAEEVKKCNEDVQCPEVCGDFKITPCTASCGGGEEIHTQECTKGGARTWSRMRYLCNDFECPPSCRPTLGGNSGGACCTFPFTYQGQTHNSCNGKGWHDFWCATTDNYDTDGKWGECDFEHLTCMSTFGGNDGLDGTPCHFPFMYRGKKVNSCINTGHDRLWCGTTANYDTDGKWGNCLPGGFCDVIYGTGEPDYYRLKK